MSTSKAHAVLNTNFMEERNSNVVKLAVDRSIYTETIYTSVEKQSVRAPKTQFGKVVLRMPEMSF